MTLMASIAERLIIQKGARESQEAEVPHRDLPTVQLSLLIHRTLRGCFPQHVYQSRALECFLAHYLRCIVTQSQSQHTQAGRRLSAAHFADLRCRINPCPSTSTQVTLVLLSPH